MGQENPNTNQTTIHFEQPCSQFKDSAMRAPMMRTAFSLPGRELIQASLEWFHRKTAAVPATECFACGEGITGVWPMFVGRHREKQEHAVFFHIQCRAKGKCMCKHQNLRAVPSDSPQGKDATKLTEIYRICREADCAADNAFEKRMGQLLSSAHSD